MPGKWIMITVCLLAFAKTGFGQNEPLRVGISGLTHTHVHGILSSEKRGEIVIVGIAEPDRELAKRYADQYGFSMSKVYPTLEALVEATKPEAVCAFGSVFEHLQVVETCAPKGIHVMVEKPLAVNLEHAQKMEALAIKHRIQLLTNYETTWYPSQQKAFELIQQQTIGDLRKVVIHDGHRGPKKIGINKEFFNWLTDPELNGGGAITDFGCYGINIMTWLMKGEKPQSVMAVTQQLQPENNPKVDDDATILLSYPHCNATILPSWNWPIGRKDIELYGLTGAIFADNKNQLRIRIAEGYDGFKEEQFLLESRPAPFDDAFALLAAVIKNKVQLPRFDPSSLENNMVVMEILEAAKTSAATGKQIVF